MAINESGALEKILGVSSLDQGGHDIPVVLRAFTKRLLHNFYSVALKNYIFLQLQVDLFTKRRKKIGKLTFETTLVYYMS